MTEEVAVTMTSGAAGTTPAGGPAGGARPATADARARQEPVGVEPAAVSAGGPGPGPLNGG